MAIKCKQDDNHDIFHAHVQGVAWVKCNKDGCILDVEDFDCEYAPNTYTCSVCGSDAEDEE